MNNIKRVAKVSYPYVLLALALHVGAVILCIVRFDSLDLRTFVMYAGVWTLALIVLTIRRFSLWKAVIYLLLLSSIYFAWTDPYNPRSPFLADLNSIKPGMTVAQVESTMKSYRVWGGESHGTTRVIIYTHRDLSGWRQNSYGGDLGGVVFKNGKVTRVEFSPD